MAEQTLAKKREEQMEAERVAQRPSRTPAVDVFEGADELVLQADMPGVGKDGLLLRIDEEELTIDGEPTDGETGKGREYAVEARVAPFHRKFTLPDGIDSGRIAAEIVAGVLTVHLPKSPAVKPRKIEVKGAT